MSITAGGAATGSGKGPLELDNVLEITTAYSISVDNWESLISR